MNKNTEIAIQTRAITKRLFLAQTAAVAGCAVSAQPQAIPRRAQVLLEAKIDDKVKNNFIAALNSLRNEGFNDISIFFGSPGGDGVSAIEMYKHIMDMQNQGIIVRSWNISDVASACCYVFLAANIRYSVANATFAFHSEGMDLGDVRVGIRDLRERLRQLSGQGDVSASEVNMSPSIRKLIEIRADIPPLLESLENNAKILREILSKRTGLSEKQRIEFSESTEAIEIDAEKALHYGIVQDIVDPSVICGSKTITVNENGPVEFGFGSFIRRSVDGKAAQTISCRLPVSALRSLLSGSSDGDGQAAN